MVRKPKRPESAQIFGRHELGKRLEDM